jgi:hypothetical protein
MRSPGLCSIASAALDSCSDEHVNASDTDGPTVRLEFMLRFVVDRKKLTMDLSRASSRSKTTTNLFELIRTRCGLTGEYSSDRHVAQYMCL